MPTFCMNAYTLVGPTKRYPCDFNCLANASDAGVDVGRSATERGARVRVISWDFASAARFGDADIIARALSTVAWILPRLRMIEASCTSRSTSGAVIAATLATSKPRKAFRNASRFPNTTDQLSPTSNTPRVSASNIADSSWMRVPQTSSWYRPEAVSPAPAQAQRGFPSCPMITSLLIRPARVETVTTPRPAASHDQAIS